MTPVPTVAKNDSIPVESQNLKLLSALEYHSLPSSVEPQPVVVGSEVLISGS